MFMLLLFVYFSFEASVMVGGARGKNLMNDFDAAVRQTLALAK